MMLTVSALARLLGISGALAYGLGQERQLPNYGIGWYVRERKRTGKLLKIMQVLGSCCSAPSTAR
jgi:hypothetical protein